MKTLVYINEQTDASEIESLLSYLTEKNIADNLNFIKSSLKFEEYVDTLTEPISNDHNKVIFHSLNDFSSLGLSIEIIQSLLSSSVEVHFSKYSYSISTPFTVNELSQFLITAESDANIIQSNSWSRSHKKLGRPRGSKNKSLMLDRFKNDIQKYIAEGFSSTTISNMLNCHPQTLRSWLNAQNEDQDIPAV